ncbi:TonB-dependent receptor [Sinomicrobium sp.]
MKYLLKTLYFIIFLLCLHPFYTPLWAQKKTQTIKVRGQVVNENGTPLPQATVVEYGTQNGVVTDMDGNFSITVSKADAKLEVSYMGYKTLYTEIAKDFIKISLQPDASQLDEVVVTQNRSITEIRKPQMSVNRLSSEEIKRIPAVLGEADPLKSLLQLPGVTNSGEASSGFNVRGGASDQNLILLDGSPIFSDSHLLGFFSVFNPDVVQEMELYKGGIPARFGGRVSSVLDVQQKTGSTDRFHMNGGIGLISSRLLAEGPFDNGKGTFMIAGRSSYAHLFLKLADNDNSGYFYDLNTKLSYQLNDNNKLFLSAYFGRDVFKLSNSFSTSYGNAMMNLRWNHQFSESLVSDLSLIYSDYSFGLDLSFYDFEWDNSIETYNFKYDFNHRISDNFQLRYGLNALYYDFNPGTIKPRDSSSFNFRQLKKKYALEPSLYVEAEHKISDRLSLNYGLRYSAFYRYGQEEINIYENDTPVIFNSELGIYENATPTGSKHYGKGEKIADFNQLEPRIGLSYAFNQEHSVKLSYNRMSQYLHLLSNTLSPTPVSTWMPSGPFIEPQILDQVAFGYFRNFKEGTYSLETEIFYKKVKNRIDYIDNAELIGNDHLETEILKGKARAYGLEVLVKKNTGKLTGWISYTLSKAEQQTPGRNPQETGINNGEWYLTPYDKLHNLAVTAGYQLNRKWSLGGNFIFQSGRPVTFPKGRYEIGGISVPDYRSRSDSRLPSYHHLDLSATYVPKPEKKKGWQGEWVFSIFNLYGRKNAASITFHPNENTGYSEATRLSVFGIIPSIIYNFKF